MEYNLPSEIVKDLNFGDQAKKKVKTVKNKDGSITKTNVKTGKSSTYTVDHKNKKRYSNPTGGEFFIQ